MSEEKLFLEYFQANEGRITNGDRWMVFNSFSKAWEVYRRPYRAKHTRMVIHTDNLRSALEALDEHAFCGSS